MDKSQVLAQFDAEMRAQPEIYGSDRVERVGPIVRVIGTHNWITYSRLDPSTVKAAVAGQTAFFRSLSQEVEWKVYQHDLPPDLGDHLRAAGFVPDPTETLMALDLSEPLRPGSGSFGVEVHRVTDIAGLSAAAAVSEEAFGKGKGWSREEFLPRLADPSFGLFVAYSERRPVSAGRLELPPGRAFASLWGGGTSPAYRGRGIYRALVAARAAAARGLGYHYLTVDALPTSRPILARLGFVPLTNITGWVLKPPSAIGPS